MKFLTLLLFSLVLVVSSVYSNLPVCPKDEEAGPTFFAVDEDCSAFYECVFGNPVLMHCPKGLYYDIVVQTCDYKENVDCDWRLIPDN